MGFFASPSARCLAVFSVNVELRSALSTAVDVLLSAIALSSIEFVVVEVDVAAFVAAIDDCAAPISTASRDAASAFPTIINTKISNDCVSINSIITNVQQRHLLPPVNCIFNECRLIHKQNSIYRFNLSK